MQRWSRPIIGTRVSGVRALRVPLGCVQLRRHDPIEPDGDLPVTVIARVQVDQGRGRRAVPHPVHEVEQGRPRLRGQGVAGVPQIVQVEVRDPDLHPRLVPDAMEVGVRVCARLAQHLARWDG